MACLLDSALRKLIGIRRISAGVRIVKSTQAHSLIDIAPAVWDLQYLQTMAVHAQVIPTIAVGLARLKNARSDSLRQKLDLISTSRPVSSGNNAQVHIEAPTTDEITNRLWSLCQTGIRPDPAKRRKTTRESAEDVIKRPLPNIEARGFELAGAPLEYAYDFDDGALMGGENHRLVTGHGHYADYPEETQGPGYCERHSFPLAGGDGIVGDGEQLGELTDNSDAEYLYADGYGNVYRIEKQDAPEQETSWPSSPPLIPYDDLSDEASQEVLVWGDEDSNEAYIIYHEVQQ
ncbi:hypothetical protein N656DRAFT_712159 [Canariomyces notabilis]|uniref:Uncharacterized protein n=1 Tax=Canariomyces notabilis TaxID=2074819 RepID=A0AAN6TBF7_9PEZI|nr:hypothetical protein N656DRAFT_712159 [Canariomyces arenarius]